MSQSPQWYYHRTDLELELGHHSQQDGGADVVQLVDEVVHLPRDAQLLLLLPQDQHVVEELKQGQALEDRNICIWPASKKNPVQITSRCTEYRLRGTKEIRRFSVYL